MSTKRPINRKTWLSPRQAASLIGREVLGREWSDHFLDQGENESPIEDILQDLYTAISSGEVTTLLSDGSDPPHVMHPKETRRLSFRIDLEKDRIELRDPMDIWLCQINAHELEQFLRRYRSTRVETKTRSQRRGDCFNWLCSEMNVGPKDGSKADYLDDAQRKFGISKHDFDSAWGEAIRETKSDWSKPGRPKSS